MVSYDIRDRYKLPDRYNDSVVYNLLLAYPPRDCKRTTGLDALVVVLRRIYAYIMLDDDGRINDQWVKDAERENPILIYAWNLMGESIEEQEAARKARSEVIKKLGGSLDAEFTPFKELCTSQLMNKTFWSQKDFCLFYPVYSYSEQDCLVQSAEEKAAESIIHLDRIANQNMTLQDAVLSKFGEKDIPIVGKVVYRPSLPLVIRVLLRTNGDIDNSETRLRFQDLQRFQLPQYETIPVKGGWGLEEGMPFDYSIQAVVKMREVGVCSEPGEFVEENDVVRTYARNLVQIYSVHEDPALMPGRWSVEDVRQYPMEYMLFYSPHPEPFQSQVDVPEVRKPEPSNQSIWDMVDEKLAPYRKEIREAKALAAKESEDTRAAAGQETADLNFKQGEGLPATTSSQAQVNISTQGHKRPFPQPPQFQVFQAFQESNRKN